MYQPTQPPPPTEGVRRPTRVEPVAGTPYGLAIYAGPPMTSGPAVGGLVAGVGAVLTSLLVSCFGLSAAAATTVEGQPAGAGVLAGGAFAILAGLLGTAGIGLSVAGLRQIRRSSTPVGGRGMAVAGIATGGSAILIAVCSLGLAGLLAVL